MLKHWKWFVCAALVFHLALAAWGLRRAQAASARDAAPPPPRSGVPAEALLPARSAREKIESAERRMADEDRALAQALDRMEAGRFNSADQHATAQALRAYIQTLRGTATDLVSHHREYVDAERQYRESLAAAPAVFRDASRLFREYAAGEPYSELKGEYEKLASDWQTLAALVEDRAAAEERDRRTYDLSDTLRYVERTALFLDRLDAHLESFPSAEDPGPLRDRTLGDLKAYIAGFEALRKHLGVFREKLRGGAVSPEVRRELSAERSLRTTGSPVSSPAVSPPKPETYPCFLSGTWSDLTIIGVAVVRDFSPGEAYRVEVNGKEHGTAFAVRNLHREGTTTFVHFKVDPPLPTTPSALVLVRKDGAPLPAAAPAVLARR